MNTAIVLDDVLPPNSVLYKQCHGAWEVYLSDDDFLNSNPYMCQDCNENFQSFIANVINRLMIAEKNANDPEPIVTIDYAIHQKEINQ